VHESELQVVLPRQVIEDNASSEKQSDRPPV
jgi:hypothetical protein